MKPSIAVVLIMSCLGTVCWGQASQKRGVPTECRKIVRVSGSFPTGPFTVLPRESYKHSPTIKYVIEEDGTVSHASITRTSGVADINKKVLDAIAQWKYKPRPAGCGVVETEITVTIHWGDSH
jgi:TonB family protein